MPTNVLSYAAHSPTDHLTPYRFVRRDLRPDDVMIDILYCGVCHTDLHTIRNDWGNSTYPVVPGHEIIGRVSKVGPEVTKYKVGDTVGVGCMVDSCGECKECKDGNEQYCSDIAFTYNSVDRHDHTPTMGGYSQKVVVSQDFVLRIPDSMDLKGAAPLLCAGITTWSPLRHWNVKPGSKVAVIGLGGLGHMAIKLAKGLGAEVSLFTRSPHKAEDARRLGADSIIISTDPEQMKAAANRFELIVDTIPYAHDLNPYIPTMAVNATLAMVGYLGPLEPPVDSSIMIMQRKNIAGSAIGGIAETQEMLDFCGEHGITSDVEVIDMKYIDDAFVRMQKSDVKYRFVIDMSTLKD